LHTFPPLEWGAAPGPMGGQQMHLLHFRPAQIPPLRKANPRYASFTSAAGARCARK